MHVTRMQLLFLEDGNKNIDYANPLMYQLSDESLRHIFNAKITTLGSNLSYSVQNIIYSEDFGIMFDKYEVAKQMKELPDQTIWQNAYLSDLVEEIYRKETTVYWYEDAE